MANQYTDLEDAVVGSDVAAALDYASENHTTVTAVKAGSADEPVHIIDHHKDRELKVLDLERLLAAPRRARGTTAIHTADSFVEWVKRAEVSAVITDVYADVFGFQVVAVLNPAREGKPAWQDHTGRLAARRHPSWQRWVNIDGKLLTQEAFAQHVQECASHIAAPPAMDMLEVAETLTLNVGATVSSAVRQRDGQRRLVFDEKVEAKAGYDREVEIPETITLRVPIFEGTDPVDVPCRLLYRARGPQVGFVVQVIDLLDVERAAFDTILEFIEEGLGSKTIAGSPATVTPAP